MRAKLTIVAAMLGACAVAAEAQQQWGQVPFTPGVVNLKCIWGRNATQVYAGSGVDNRVYVYDGSAWATQVATLPMGVTITGVTGDSATTYACGGFNGVCSAPAGSATWTFMNTSAISSTLNCIAKGTSVTYAGGSSGRYGYLTGTVWNGVQTSLLTTNFWGVAASTSSGIIVGDAGAILSLQSNGSWSIRVSNTTDTLYGVSQQGVNVVAVGAGGRIVRSTNSGVGWTPINHGLTGSTLRAVAGAGNTFIAAGDGGVILRSTDGGATWALDASNSPASLTGVWMTSDGSRAYAVGEGGIVRTWPMAAPGAFAMASPSNGMFVETTTPTVAWSASLNAYGGYTLTLDDSADMASPLLVQSGIMGTSLAIPTDLLSPNSIYYVRVVAANAAGTVAAAPDPSRFGVIAAPTTCDPDFNHDGNMDQDDVVALITVVAGGECP